MIGAPDRKINYLISVQKKRKFYKVYKNILHLSTKVSNPEFQGEYLAGLWEADGHIWIPAKEFSPKGKRYTPYFCITFRNTEKPFVELLQSKLGGYIRYKNKENAQVLMIYKYKEILYILHLQNGKLRTPKEYQQKGQIKWINIETQRKKDKKIKIEEIKYKGLDKIPLNQSAWFSGFIDGDGSFDIRSRTTPKKRIEIIFRLEQRMEIKGKSNEPIQTEICKTFKLNKNKSKHGGKYYFLIYVTSPKKISLLINYLQQFPMFTSKQFNFQIWVKVQKQMQDKQHLTTEGFNKITQQKNQMNKSLGTRGPWSHLKYFYKHPI